MTRSVIKRKVLESLIGALVPPLKRYMLEQLALRDTRIAQLEELAIDEVAALQKRVDALEQKP